MFEISIGHNRLSVRKKQPKTFIIKMGSGVTDNGKPQETVGRKAKGAKTKVKPARLPNISDQII